MFNISDRIKYYRRKKGMTQMQVATALGIRTDNYTKYESGARVPKDDRLIALAKILDVSYNALHEGVEQEFVGLLSRHAIGAVLGDMDGFDAFAGDMETSSETYYVIVEFLNKGASYFMSNAAAYYQKYIETPELATLIALYDTYKEQLESDLDKQDGNQSAKWLNPIPSLSGYKTTKWAYCIAVKNYLENNDTDAILYEAGKIAGNLDALQFFAVKVFVPYLAFIIDSVELCTNTTIDDFEISFLFDALTPPEDEPDDDGEDDGEDD